MNTISISAISPISERIRAFFPPSLQQMPLIRVTFKHSESPNKEDFDWNNTRPGFGGDKAQQYAFVRPPKERHFRGRDGRYSIILEENTSIGKLNFPVPFPRVLPFLLGLGING